MDRQDEADRGARHYVQLQRCWRRIAGCGRSEATASRQRGTQGGECVFRLGDRPDPEAVMNFIDAHDFSVGLVLRVLGIAASTYYGWRKARQQPSRRTREDAGLLTLIDEIRGSHEFAATYGSPRVCWSCTAAGCGSPASGWSGSCASTAAAAPICARAGSTGPPGKTPSTRPRRSARPRLHRDCTQPQVGGRSDSHPHRRGCAVAGQRS